MIHKICDARAYISIMNARTNNTFISISYIYFHERQGLCVRQVDNLEDPSFDHIAPPHRLSCPKELRRLFATRCDSDSAVSPHSHRPVRFRVQHQGRLASHWEIFLNNNPRRQRDELHLQTSCHAPNRILAPALLAVRHIAEAFDLSLQLDASPTNQLTGSMASDWSARSHAQLRFMETRSRTNSEVECGQILAVIAACP